MKNLHPCLRSGDSRLLDSALRRLIGAKPARHRLSTTEAPHTPFAMSNIGG